MQDPTDQPDSPSSTADSSLVIANEEAGEADSLLENQLDIRSPESVNCAKAPLSAPVLANNRRHSAQTWKTCAPPPPVRYSPQLFGDSDLEEETEESLYPDEVFEERLLPNFSNECPVSTNHVVLVDQFEHIEPNVMTTSCLEEPSCSKERRWRRSPMENGYIKAEEVRKRRDEMVRRKSEEKRKRLEELQRIRTAIRMARIADREERMKSKNENFAKMIAEREVRAKEKWQLMQKAIEVRQQEKLARIEETARRRVEEGTARTPIDKIVIQARNCFQPKPSANGHPKSPVNGRLHSPKRELQSSPTTEHSNGISNGYKPHLSESFEFETVI